MYLIRLIEPGLIYLCLFIFITGFLLCHLVLRGSGEKHQMGLLGMEMKHCCKEKSISFLLVLSDLFY